MRPEELPPIHANVADGHDIRRRAAVAINSVLLSPLVANKSALALFFLECANKATGAPAGARATVLSGQSVTVPVTGTYVNKITPTVVNGVITAIVLG